MKIIINKPTEFEAVYLEVDAGVRYWDDGYINGMEDTDCEETDGIPQMPCSARVHYKVCDDFLCDILDGNKNVITSYDGYVPKIMCPADEGYGDYIIMNIDENGFIQGWKKELIKRLIQEED